MFIDIM